MAGQNLRLALLFSAPVAFIALGLIVIRGRVRRRIKDNQLELIFEGSKLVIQPLFHGRAEVMSLVNSMPAEVRDDGVLRWAMRLRPAMHRTGPGSN